MSPINDTPYNWHQFHAYRVFEEFLEEFILNHRSYLSTTPVPLDLPKAFDEIQRRFIDEYDDTNKTFEEKIELQFPTASEQTKLVFANVEYLWAMPTKSVGPKRKEEYATRWFPEPRAIVSGTDYFFTEPHTIADPGSWYNRNKYWELIACFRILHTLISEPHLDTVPKLKERIAELTYSAIYDGVPSNIPFSTSRKCGSHAALLHLSDPEKYESIISESHKEQITAVFGHILDESEQSSCREETLKNIRTKLYHSYSSPKGEDWKYRWLFYIDEVKALWIDKKTKKAQRQSSATFDIRLEEDAIDLEGTKEEVTGFRIRRSAKLVKAAKERDHYTCRACGFHFERQIVHVHHLDPICEYKHPKETTVDDLITLCPTCHYIAHYWLRKSPRYKGLETLLKKLGAE
ncbi:HNH endonuclease [Verrucomicrobiaceae bacterium 227]